MTIDQKHDVAPLAIKQAMAPDHSWQIHRFDDSDTTPTEPPNKKPYNAESPLRHPILSTIDE
jgi:hypothetical protein